MIRLDRCMNEDGLVGGRVGERINGLSMVDELTLIYPFNANRNIVS